MIVDRRMMSSRTSPPIVSVSCALFAEAANPNGDMGHRQLLSLARCPARPRPRGPRDEQGRGHADAGVVLGDSAWQRKFGGDPQLRGRSKVERSALYHCRRAASGPGGTFAFSDSDLYLPLNWSGSGVAPLSDGLDRLPTSSASAGTRWYHAVRPWSTRAYG